jgi:hypothetical protein
MDTVDISRKKLYDALVNLISHRYMQNALSGEEMHCLLSILDLVVLGKRDFGLLETLKEWDASDLEPEIHDIIKATLLSMDFTDLELNQRNMETIRELLRYNQELKDNLLVDP